MQTSSKLAELLKPDTTASPTAVVVSTHEHLPASAADGAVRLVAVIVVLVRTFQEAVLHKKETR